VEHGTKHKPCLTHERPKGWKFSDEEQVDIPHDQRECMDTLAPTHQQTHHHADVWLQQSILMPKEHNYQIKGGYWYRTPCQDEKSSTSCSRASFNVIRSQDANQHHSNTMTRSINASTHQHITSIPVPNFERKFLSENPEKGKLRWLCAAPSFGPKDFHSRCTAFAQFLNSLFEAVSASVRKMQAVHQSIRLSLRVFEQRVKQLSKDCSRRTQHINTGIYRRFGVV
jgi:hypothetical protein